MLSNSMMTQGNIFNAFIFINNKIFSIQIDKTVPINQTFSQILQNFSLDPSSCEIIFYNKKINPNDKRPMYAIVNSEIANPCFFINKKNLVAYSQRNNDISFFNKKRKSENMKINNLLDDQTTVTVSNYTNTNDITNILNLFFYNMKMQNNTQFLTSRNNNLNILFQSSQTANDFVNYFQYLSKNKFINNKMSVKILNNSNPTSPKKTRSITENVPLPLIVNYNQISKNTPNNKNNVYKIKINKNILKDKRNNYHTPIAKKIENTFEKSLFNVDRNTINHNINNFYLSKRIKNSKSQIIDQNSNSNLYLLNEFYSRQKYIRNASPYISEEDKYLLEKNNDKKYWVDKKDFLLVGSHPMKNNFISNYVEASPSDPPVNYKFREVKKDKWITKKGFI